MSRRIDTSKPLSVEDVQYLEDRSRTNELEFLRETGKLPDSEADRLAQQTPAPAGAQPPAPRLAGPPPPDDDPEADWLDAWTVAQLKEELGKPKYGVTFKADAKKAELKELLYDALEAQEDDTVSEEDAK